MQTRTGRSLCGAVNFIAEEVATDFGVCHCVMSSEMFVDLKPAGFAFAGDHPRLTEKETLEKYAEFVQ